MPTEKIVGQEPAQNTHTFGKVEVNLNELGDLKGFEITTEERKFDTDEAMIRRGIKDPELAAECCKYLELMKKGEYDALYNAKYKVMRTLLNVAKHLKTLAPYRDEYRKYEEKLALVLRLRGESDVD